MSHDITFSEQFNDWAAAIRQRESTNNYSVPRNIKSNTLGAYQITDLALEDAGFKDKLTGQWTSLAQSLGVDSDATFLENHYAQDLAFRNLIEAHFHYLRSHQSYIGKTIGGVKITEAGMLAGAQLFGQAGVKDFLKSGGRDVRRDVHGVLITEYMKEFGGYNFRFDRKTKSFVDLPNPGSTSKQNKSLHKAAVAIGRAHPISIAPRPTKGSGKHSAGRTIFYAGTGAAKLTIAQLRGIGLAPFGSRSGGVLGVNAVQQKSSSSKAKTLAARDGVSSTAALALAQYRATAASRILKATPPSGAAATVAGALQRLTSAAIRLNLGLPTSVAPVGVGPQRVTGSANVEPAGPQFASSASSSQNEASSRQPYRAGQNTNWQHEFSEFLDRQARLPPNGGAGFDRRLSPAWPGLKLPS